jgi:hypothetical protein
MLVDSTSSSSTKFTFNLFCYSFFKSVTESSYDACTLTFRSNLLYVSFDFFLNVNPNWRKESLAILNGVLFTRGLGGHGEKFYVIIQLLALLWR